MQTGGIAAIYVQGRVEARKTAAVVKQVHPNGGSSMADAVNRSAANSAEAVRLAQVAAETAANVEIRVDRMSTKVGNLDKRLSKHIDGS